MVRKVCVVGAGIGAAHCAAYAQLPERFEVASVCDIDVERGQSLAAEHGARFVTDYTGELADPDIDIIDICLPPHLHFDLCAAALAAGKTVICEKPLVCSLGEADALQRKADETGGKVFPVFQYRYGPGMAQLSALIDAGLAGACYAGSLETHWDRDGDYYSVPWRGTWDGERGGAVLGHAIHIHDLLTAILGPCKSVFAETATRVNDIEFEDCAALAIRMAGGAVITSSITLGASGNTSRLRLAFEGFTVESDTAPYSPAESPWSFTARAPVTQAQIDAVLAVVLDARPGFAGFFEAVADELDGRAGNAVTLDDARRSLEFVTGVYASSRTGKRVEFPLPPDHPMRESWLPET